jgi:ribonuclease E
MVERRLKEALRHDRARIQVGRISHFGLMEMSRQRLRPSLTEHSFVTCAHCQGLGIVRSEESSALHVLRAIEEEGAKRRAAEIVVHCSPAVAMHILNRKRERLAATEARHDMCVVFEPDATLSAAQNRIDRIRPQTQPAPSLGAPALRMDYAPEPVFLSGGDEEESTIADEAEEEVSASAEGSPEGNGQEGNGEERGRRRRRRRRGGRREEGASPEAADAADAAEGEEAAEEPEAEAEAETPAIAAEGEGPAERAEGEAAGSRRRGRRGGRRRREDEAPRAEGVEAPAAAPRYAGPTPADPFAGQYDDLLDAMDAVEEAQVAAPRSVREIPIASAPAEAQPAETQPLDVTSGEAPAEAAAPAQPEASPEPAPAAPEPAPVAPARAAEATLEPASDPAKAEPVVGAVVQPVLLGTEDAPAAPAKKGWWRR